MRRITLVLFPGMVLATLLWLGRPPTAEAATAIHATSYTGAQSFDQVDGAQLLNLGGGNGTTLVVETDAPTRLAIFFSAECTVAAPDDVSWVDIDIRVDGVAIAPSDSDDAFCTSDSDNNLDNWLFSSRDAAVDVPAGVHAITIQAQFGNGDPGSVWRIDDLSLIVVADEN